MKTFFIFFLAVITILISCQQSRQMQKYPVGLSQIIDSGKIAILQIPTDSSETLKIKNGKATSLTEAELKQTEAILNAAIASIHKNSPDTNRLLNYKRQYIPYINEQGEKLVWVNCFCISFDEFKNWKTEIANTDLVMDGGDCFIKVTINLPGNSFSDLRTHGYA